MEKITRSKTPDWLTEKWQEWGEKWQSKYESTQKSNDFRWYRHKNQGYDELVKELSKMTQHHCSFCDAYHKVKRIPHTIEHFKPKTKFPLPINGRIYFYVVASTKKKEMILTKTY